MKAAQSVGAPSVSAAQMGGSGQPQNADVAGQASIPPEAAQTLQQGLQGPLGPQYQQIIKLVKQANPNAPPAVRAMIVHDMMESVNAQSSAMVKMLQEQLKQQQEIERERHDVATEENQGNRTTIYQENADTARTREQDTANALSTRVRIALDKAGLGDEEDTKKVLNFASRNAQSHAEGNVSGRTQVARADAQAVLEKPAAQAALAYLPPQQNALQGYMQNAVASFKNDPKYNSFKANNLVAAGEIARAAAGGGLPRAGLTDEIAAQLNRATDQEAWLAAAAGYLKGANTTATATSGVVQQSGNEGQAPSIAGSPPGGSQIPPPPPGFVVQ